MYITDKTMSSLEGGKTGIKSAFQCLPPADVSHERRKNNRISLGNRMENINQESSHTFHIPVMGTGFTIDTPLRVARYGISSVISLVDDVLIEQMRKHHCTRIGDPYQAIGERDHDKRARRITAYLNLIDRLVEKQIEELKRSPFEEGSEITLYFNLLPDCPLRKSYEDMLAIPDSPEKQRRQQELREQIVPGSIDVNVMTKLDRDSTCGNGGMPEPNCSDAVSALRGFAKSSLRSSIVCSAGMNRRFYSSFSAFDDFFPNEHGFLKKKIILKVSDQRSAAIQGKFLAKRGLWVSEYRIESGLNCGGHAFPTNGYLMGPIIEELMKRKDRMVETFHGIYSDALVSLGRPAITDPYPVKVTVQGGIGTAPEHEMLLKFFEVDGTGWATPFLLVPEVVAIDDEHLEKLVAASDSDVYLSDTSPLDIPFWSLRNSASEEMRRQRIRQGRPGSACRKNFLQFSTEYSEKPLCTASQAYQKLKLVKLPDENLSAEQLAVIHENTLNKTCICHDLGGSATRKYGIDPDATPSICCGPNIINFSKVATLQEMVSHIYGRESLPMPTDRPHMFASEIKIYIDYLGKEIEKCSLGLPCRTPAQLSEFRDNMLEGIERYHQIAEAFIGEQKSRFLKSLQVLQLEIESISLTPAL